MTATTDALEAVMWGLAVALSLLGAYGFGRKEYRDDPPMMLVASFLVGVGIAIGVGAYFVHAP